MNENADRSFEIHKSNLWRLEERVARLARKARKYGLPEPTLEITGEGTRKIVDPRDHMDTGYVQPVVYVRLTGEVPRLEGGWSLIAIVDHRGEPGDRGWLVSQIPWTVDDGIEVPEHYRHEEPTCDHCQTQRQRSDTFILRSDDGEWKRVGRQCMKDYLRDQSARVYASYLYDLHSIRFEDYREIESRKSYFDTRSLLIVAAAMIEEYGWSSRRDENMDPIRVLSTASRAMNHFYKKDKDLVIGSNHESQVDEALAWLEEGIGSKDEGDLSGYEWNLLVAASRDYTALKHTGIVVSLLRAHQRAQIQADDENGKDSEHMGDVGKREDFLLTVVRRMDIEVGAYVGNYTDTMRITVMEDDNGNVFVWRTTAKKLEEGQRYAVRGTIKEHGDYQGTKQTILTRCAISCPDCGKKMEMIPLNNKAWVLGCIEHYPHQEYIDRGWIKTSKRSEA